MSIYIYIYMYIYIYIYEPKPVAAPPHPRQRARRSRYAFRRAVARRGAHETARATSWVFPCGILGSRGPSGIGRKGLL